MQVAYCLPTLIICSYCSSITLPQFESNPNLLSCLDQIIEHYFQRKMITYVDMNYKVNDIIKTINASPATIISRNTDKNLLTFNVEYIIAAETSRDFTLNFPSLMKEPRWNPFAIFLIIVKSLKPKDLRNIFDLLLKSHVNNVVLVNGTNEIELYTYNPFDRYNCGKKYDDIIKLGKCLHSSGKHLYPDKLVTGLRNCTFKATAADWPPYAINVTNSKESEAGVEQYVFHIISELEGFQVEYTENIDGEDFSTIGDNMSTTGTLLMLQAKETDFIFGGMLLLDFRADAFNFICGHLPYKDDIRIFVQKAGQVTVWKNLVLEFKTTVWIVLIVTFFCYFLLLVAILGVKDKSSLFLIMLDLFFLHGNRMVCKSRTAFIFWVIFTYLINVYYQSSLVSITANPIKNYQISTKDDLTNYNLEACISIVLQKYIIIVRSDYSPELDYYEGCTHLIESIRSVSRTPKKYTVSLYSIYLYNKYLFYKERGEEPIYPFKDPMNKVIYAIYFNKGFPLQDKLNLHTIRLRENGLIDNYLQLLYYKREKHFIKHVTDTMDHSLHLIFPWYILVVGFIFAIGLFLLEIFSKNKLNYRRKVILS